MTATKRITRIGALFLLVVTIITSLMVPALAASTTSSRNCSGDSDGQTWRYVYVKTGDTSNSKKVTLTMTKGKLVGKMYGVYDTDKYSRYGAYEIKVCYWNGSSWVQEQNYDVYNKSSKTITMKKSNTYYRILVYSWNATTVFRSYFNNGIITTPGVTGDTADYYENCYWSTIPGCTAKPKSGCTMYTSTPTSKS